MLPASSIPPPTPSGTVPLCVDLDGTLVLTDTLWESVLLHLRRHPWQLGLLVVWALRGRAHFKRELGRRVNLDVRHLPYNPAVMQLLQTEAEAGREIVLVTAAHESIAHAVAAHLAVISTTLATGDHENLKGIAKAARLTSRFGERGFDYIGNDRADLPVWRAARRALVANASPGLTRQAREELGAEVLAVARPRPASIWRRQLRVHQWSKNLLVFVPVAGAHVGTVRPWFAALLAAVTFSACASSVYLLNDLFDLEADRQHRTKRTRPLAAGAIPIPQALAAIALLLALAAAGTMGLPPAFGLVLAGYFAVTFAYSLRLKRMLLLDAICLAALYMTRVFAGGVAVGVPLSSWLLAFTVFLFFGLGLAKRFVELKETTAETASPLKGRAYMSGDLPMVATMGVASSYLAVLVLAFYVTSPEVTALYHRPFFLWGGCVGLLYWISRLWMLANRGHMHEDPVVFALRDRVSYVFLVSLALLGAAAHPK